MRSRDVATVTTFSTLTSCPGASGISNSCPARAGSSPMNRMTGSSERPSRNARVRCAIAMWIPDWFVSTSSSTVSPFTSTDCRGAR
jgi:hypothetical protein